MGRPRTGCALKIRGNWIARITLHREEKLPNGRHPRAEIPITRSDAQVTETYAHEFALRAQHRYDEGTWVPPNYEPRQRAGTSFAPVPLVPPKHTVATWADYWLAKQKYSGASKDRATVALWLPRTALAEIPLSAVTPKDCARFLEKLAVLPSPKTKEPPAPRTQRNIVDPIARALRAAVFEGHLVADPFAVVPTELRPKAVDANPGERAAFRLTRGQAETLLGEPSIEDRWLTFWTLLVLTGARVSEILALRWCDLEPSEPLGRVTIAWQIHHRTRKRVPTKTGSTGTMPVHPILAARLAWWKEEGWLAEYGCRPKLDDLLVPARAEPGRPWGTSAGAGGALWSQDVHRSLQRDLLACGIDAHRVHDLRHTFVSLCADFGMAPEVASRWTHTPLVAGGGARGLYLVPSWERQCEEMLKLKLAPRGAVARTGS